jgi:hypothetical protein
MAKNSITDYSNTAASNTDIQSVDIDEGCLPSGINNAIREIMADLADVNDGTVSLTSPAFAAASLTGDLSFGDNNKAIFGAGSDLQIYHDGSDSYIVDNGTGDLLIRAENNLFLKRTNSDETYFSGAVNGAVTLFHNNNAKIATTISGIDVNGTVAADGLTVEGTNGNFEVATTGNSVNMTRAGNNFITASNASGDLYLGAGGTSFLKVDNVGDISFYEDTGTTAKLFWDASAERLGLGTSLPSAPLHIVNSSLPRIEMGYGGGSNADHRIAWDSAGLLISADQNNQSSGSSYLAMLVDGSERVRITSAGLVGIGTTSPATYGVDNADDLVIGQGDGHHGITISSYGTSNGTLAFSDQTGATVGRGFVNYDHNVNAMSFGTLSTERMRIDSSGVTTFKYNTKVYTGGYPEIRLGISDSNYFNLVFDNPSDLLSIGKNGSTKMSLTASGNLLVGKTISSSATVGITLEPAGAVVATRDGGECFIANRKTSDGTIIQLRKDQTTVGSIGTVEGDIYVGTGDTGLLFNDANNQIRPYNTTTQNSIDNAIDIGRSSTRFKDLHLSGTANAGGLSVSAASGAAISAANTGTVASVLMSVDSSVNSIYSRGVNSSTARDLRFMMGSTESMRIDSSGNLLVGKTSSSFTTEGAEFREDGRLGVTSVSDIAAYFNRTSTDGDIVRFIKFNTTVGSIGTQGGAATIGNGVTGLRFSTAGYVHPHNITTNTASDNTTDLGASTARFKDLRLGGTAYASSAVIEGSSGLGNLEATLQVRSTETMAAGTGGTISLMGDDGTGTQRTFGMIKGAKGDASSGAFGGGLEFYTRTNGIGDAVKSMVIDQYGLVGIGTSSPSVALEVNSASFQMMKLRRGTSGTSAGIITFEQGNGNAVGHIGGAGDNGGLQFRTGFGTGTERMRIDSAGNLMVGKTSATVANDGFTASSAGYVTITDSSFQPLILNRKTSDGTILELRKNNATVGSIGVEGGDNFYITDNNNTGLNMKSGLIIPCNTNGSTRDNAIDLGASSGRFKDLYLGGGVYLGGTTAANHLDDYEEGTWTPTVSLGTISVIRAVYTKIGRAVTVTATILRTTASSSTDTLQITGLPFQGSINGEWLGAAMNNGSNLQSTGIVSYMYGPSDPDRILIYSNRDNASPLSMKHNEFGLNNYLYFTITYFT